MPLHVMHVIDGLGLGGAERMLVDIANRTIADGHRVTVCVTRHQTTLGPELDARARLLVLRRKSKFSLVALGRLAAYIRRENVDVMHVHLRSNLAFAVQLRALRLVSTPIVFHDHYGTIELDSEVPLWFRAAQRYIARYVGVYEKLASWARAAGIDETRITTIRNTVDLARLRSAEPSNIRAELGFPADVPIAIIVATVRPDKGIEVLLQAIALSKHRTRLRVVVVGADGEASYAASCRTLRTALELEDTVVFVGGRSDVPSLLLAADLGLLTSHTESGPLVLLEYLAAGLPLVATRVGDIGRYLADSGVPGFVDPGDPKAIADALDQLLELSPADRRARGELGKRLLTQLWDIRASMPTWYEIYRTVLNP